MYHRSYDISRNTTNNSLVAGRIGEFPPKSQIEIFQSEDLLAPCSQVNEKDNFIILHNIILRCKNYENYFAS